ncbi:MAG: VOC family protein [Rhodospirillaceae bacterium]|nr:VOC family protein [Rhodospirillaceae bacterium]
MGKLRHFAICVSDLEKSARFYEEVFGLERVGREDLEIGSGIYLSDGVVNLALLSYRSGKGAGREDAARFIGPHHFGFVVDDLADAQAKIEAAGGAFFFKLGDDAERSNFELKFKDPDGVVFDISKKGWLGSRGDV